MSDLYIPTTGLPILLEEICWPNLGHMNVEIGAEAALCPEKEYKSGIFVAVYLIICTYTEDGKLVATVPCPGL